MTFKPVPIPEHLYFITASIVGWKPLLAIPSYNQIILNSLEWHRLNHRLRLYAFVIMPTHLHAMIKPSTNFDISHNLQSFGSFTAHALLQQLRKENRAELLSFFANNISDRLNQNHQIWQPIQAKNIYTEDFLWQKFEYIHNNPVQKKWHLAKDRADYPFSSACLYDRNEQPVITVDDIRDLF